MLKVLCLLIGHGKLTVDVRNDGTHLRYGAWCDRCGKRVRGPGC